MVTPPPRSMTSEVFFWNRVSLRVGEGICGWPLWSAAWIRSGLSLLLALWVGLARSFDFLRLRCAAFRMTLRLRYSSLRVSLGGWACGVGCAYRVGLALSFDSAVLRSG